MTSKESTTQIIISLVNNSRLTNASSISEAYETIYATVDACDNIAKKSGLSVSLDSAKATKPI